MKKCFEALSLISKPLLSAFLEKFQFLLVSHSLFDAPVSMHHLSLLSAITTIQSALLEILVFLHHLPEVPTTHHSYLLSKVCAAMLPQPF